MNKKKWGKFALVLLLIAFLLFVALAIFVSYHSVLKLDIYLSRDLQSEGDSLVRKDLLYNTATFISFFGKTFVAAALVVLVAAFFWLGKYYRETVFTILVPISSLINWVIKLIVNRPRPSDTFVSIIDKQMDPSFPSGHTVFYTAFFGFLIAAMIKNKKISNLIRYPVIIISTILIVSVSYSRIYLGAHWASDVIGGYLVGGLCLYLLLYFYNKK